MPPPKDPERRRLHCQRISKATKLQFADSLTKAKKMKGLAIYLEKYYSNGREGENSPRWKAVVTIKSAHRWAAKTMAQPETCVCCGARKCPVCGKAGIVHKCNIDHKYRKKIEEWFWACNQCHRDIDIKNGLRKDDNG
jgi:hypothetical protein